MTMLCETEQTQTNHVTVYMLRIHTNYLQNKMKIRLIEESWKNYKVYKSLLDMKKKKETENNVQQTDRVSM